MLTSHSPIPLLKCIVHSFENFFLRLLSNSYIVCRHFFLPFGENQTSNAHLLSCRPLLFSVLPQVSASAVLLLICKSRRYLEMWFIRVRILELKLRSRVLVYHPSPSSLVNSLFPRLIYLHSKSHCKNQSRRRKKWSACSYCLGTLEHLHSPGSSLAWFGASALI